MLYPLKFNPILKEMLWGGKKIPAKLNIDVADDATVGENFAISGLKNDMSVVSEGALKGKALADLIEEHKGALIGDKVYEKFGTKFPLLLKYIDANDDLSIQVHPNDALAAEVHNSFGKTEMWYVVESEKGAALNSGFSKKTTAAEFEQMHNENKIMDLMSPHKTEEGDTFFIPAGKVHSIGSGNLIAEIQQTSDITYRIYDFDRRDKFGNPRELHHELAMNAMNFSDDDSGKVDYSIKANESVNLATCEYFTTNIIEVKEKIEKDYSAIDSFVILMNVGGACNIECNGTTTSVNEMETVLIPASEKNITIQTENSAKLLEVYL